MGPLDASDRSRELAIPFVLPGLKFREVFLDAVAECGELDLVAGSRIEGHRRRGRGGRSGDGMGGGGGFQDFEIFLKAGDGAVDVDEAVVC